MRLRVLELNLGEGEAARDEVRVVVVESRQNELAAGVDDFGFGANVSLNRLVVADSENCAVGWMSMPQTWRKYQRRPFTRRFRSEARRLRPRRLTFL